MTQTAVLASIAETTVLQNKKAKGVVEALMAVACEEQAGKGSRGLVEALMALACEQIKNNENFKLANMLVMTMKKKPTCCWDQPLAEQAGKGSRGGAYGCGL